MPQLWTATVWSWECVSLAAVPGVRSLAAKLREQIETEARRGHDVWVDFDGIVSISPSAGDEIFAKLDPQALGHAHFQNMPVPIEALARFVVANRGGKPQS